MRSKLTRSQVAHARQRAADGEPIRQIAQDIGVTYQYIWNAIRGFTFRWIADPPPIPVGTPRPVRLYTCDNPDCGESFPAGHGRGLCPRCATYYRRNGRNRPADMRPGHYVEIPRSHLLALYQRYEAGESMETLAENTTYAAETLRRRFHEAGLHVHPTPAGSRQKLTAALVRQARHLVHNEGRRVHELAKEHGVNYQTLYTAVHGFTWRSAGGPLPQTAEELQECRRCGLLSRQAYCRFCRQEGARS